MGFDSIWLPIEQDLRLSAFHNEDTQIDKCAIKIKNRAGTKSEYLDIFHSEAILPKNDQTISNDA